MPLHRCRACHLLRKHALVPFAAPAGLAAAARCSLTFLSYCAALEASHALRLAPLAHRELWLVLEQVWCGALWCVFVGGGGGEVCFCGVGDGEWWWLWLWWRWQHVSGCSLYGLLLLTRSLP